MNPSPSPMKALLLAIFLVGIGFVVGYGFQSSANQNRNLSSTPTPAPAQAPIVKALQASPDAKKLALTANFDNSDKAGLWIFDIKSKNANYYPSPIGWQDFVVGWKNPESLLIERERIPRGAAEATGGMYSVPVNDGKTDPENWTLHSPKLARGEKLISGFYSPDGVLHLKTRNEPKTIWRVENDKATRLDQSALAYGQNRVTRNGNQDSLFVVRDISPTDSRQALFRVENRKSTQISEPIEDLSWSYVAPSGKHFLIAREVEEEWLWTLYDIVGNSIREVKEAPIPSDVISVYWSQDEKRILGAAGDKLWIIDIPSLRCTQLGTRTGWNSDDATWIDSQTIGVASNGKLWSLEVPSGRETLLWTFPKEFWQ
jgi:hypothetical protein